MASEIAAGQFTMAGAARVRSGGEADSPPAGIRCRRLSRSFGSTRALDGVDLDVPAGTTHALVGQNGAGKSTCLGIIAGRIRPTSGEVTVFGDAFHYGSPRAAQGAGVAAVYQELTVVPQLSPHANVFLARPMTRWGCLRQRRMRQEYEQVCESLGIPASPDVPAGQLTVAQQQLIEIVRAVVSKARLILLDEPTAALAIEERRALFRVLHSLRDGGTTVMLVSHNLDEVLENANDVTVFRDGRLIATRPASAWDKRTLIEQMLGGSSRELLEVESGRPREPEPAAPPAAAAPEPAAPAAAVPRRKPLLRIDHVNLAGRLRDVSLEVGEGEVLGIAGLMGSGRSSLLRAVAGAEADVSGELWIDGAARPWPGSPRAARQLGIGMVAEDRKTEGVCLEMTCAENVALPGFGTLSRFGYLSPRRVAARTAPLLDAVGVDTGKIGDAARTLSGGNQQKLLFARMSYQRPRVLLADEPTRGVDVGAKADILEEVRRMAHEEGIGVVLVSSELEEVLAFSDRIVVMAAGRVTRELDNTNGDVSESDVLGYAFQSGRAIA